MTEKFYPFIVVVGNAKNDQYGCDDLADAMRTQLKYGGTIRNHVGARNPAKHDGLVTLRKAGQPPRTSTAVHNPAPATQKPLSRAKLAGEAEATRSTIAILDRRGKVTQANAFRRELAAAVRANNEPLVRQIRSKVVAAFGPVANPSERPPAGFEGYHVESISEGVDSVNFQKCKVYNVIAPDGTSGTLHRHDGKYKYHEQLDMFGYTRAAPPPPVVQAKEPPRQIGMMFNPAPARSYWREEMSETDARRVLGDKHFDWAVAQGAGYCGGRATGWADANDEYRFAAYRTAQRCASGQPQRNPLRFIATAVAYRATGKAIDHVIKQAKRNPEYTVDTHKRGMITINGVTHFDDELMHENNAEALAIMAAAGDTNAKKIMQHLAKQKKENKEVGKLEGLEGAFGLTARGMVSARGSAQEQKALLNYWVMSGKEPNNANEAARAAAVKTLLHENVYYLTQAVAEGVPHVQSAFSAACVIAEAIGYDEKIIGWLRVSADRIFDRQRNPAPAQVDATNWMGNKRHLVAGREVVRTYPKVDGKRERADVDVSAFSPLVHEIQEINKWRQRLPRHPDAPPPKLVKSGRGAGCHVSPLVTKCAGDGVPWGDALMANGKTIEYIWQVSDLNDLRVSHNAESLTVNSNYPQELQPRDRSRQGYHDQIQRLVKDFDPSLLMWSANASDGAPIVAPDGVVESGNGRSIALTRIFAHHPAKARQYMQTAKSWAAELGCKWPAWADSVGARPLLVRVRQTEVDRAEFARQANVAGQQVMSATEMAISDANSLTPQLLSSLDPNAGIGTGANARFVGDFIKYVSGEASRGEMADARGRLSKAGELRIDYALFARAWGGKAHNLIASMAEVRESDLRTILASLLDCSVAWAGFSDDIDAGRLGREYDETHNIVGMVQRVAAAKEAGATIHEMRAQGDILDALSVDQNLWICAAFPKGQRPNAKTFASAINNYINFVRAQGKVAPDMFGETHSTPPLDFVRQVVVDVVCTDLPKAEAAKKPRAIKTPKSAAAQLRQRQREASSPKTERARVALQTAQRFDDWKTIAIMPNDWQIELSVATKMPVNDRADIIAMAQHIAPERKRNPPCKCGGRCGPCATRGARSRSNRRAGR